MHFLVTEECRRLGLRAGAILFRGVRVGPAGSALRAEIAAEVEAVRGRLESAAAVRALPEVVAFQELLRKVGVNPRRDRPSVERLLTLAVQRGELPAVNSLVDTYNLVSVRRRCSLGAHDFDLIAPPVSLRVLSGEESFQPLGGGGTTIAAGEYGYVDALGRALCRLDVLQADFSKVTDATVNALLIIEGTSVHAAEVLRGAFDDAAELVTRHCGGTAEVVQFPDLS